MSRDGRKTGGGSRKGCPNKSTVALKDAISHVVSATQDQALGWLQSVAEGEKEYRFDDAGQPLLDATGEQLFDWARRPEPGTALKLWSDLAEFLQPKLARTEIDIEGSIGTYDISERPLSADEWATQAENHLATATGAAKASN